MGKYDKEKITTRSEDYDNTRRIKTHNILCDVASEISELKEVIDRFSEICKPMKRSRSESVMRRIMRMKCKL